MQSCVSNDTHAWNAIYINGEWIEVDITANINRYACSGFMTYAVNDALPDTATRFCFQ
ncbi:MAG: hypothetical protein K2H82_07950 [Oscillospiraceae bacterium]|nr:hypothetical protein [Oscillospiraceae bacterium]